MKFFITNRRRAMGFVEVLIAVLVVTASAIPVIYMVTSSRTDTSKAINYLRAVELANEVLEWASLAEYSQLDDSTFAAFCGSLTEESAGNLIPANLAVTAPENPVWKADSLMSNNLSYSGQYSNAFFYREVAITDVDDSYLQPGLLKKVTVTVKWSEAHRPANLNVPDDRTRQVELSVLLLNEKNLNY